jgi:osmoprotectant transport system permease protein
VERETDLPTERVPSLGSTVAYDAVRSGDIDVYVDYSGTIWATIMKRESVGQEREDVLGEVGRYLKEEDGVVMTGALGFENTYAFAVREPVAERLGLETVSDLIPHAPDWSLGGDYEFFSRPEWAEIQEVYGLEFRERRSMDSALMYQAVAQGSVDVITAFSTDGRIAALDLRVLDDDRGAIPPYDAVVLVGPRLAREHPEALEALRALNGTLDAERMRRMNLEVDEEKRSPEAVARDFLERFHTE